MAQEIHLRGLLIPKDWYSNGKIKTLALATDDEKEISIGNPAHHHIMRHLRQRVELWGTFEDPLHHRVFQVNRLKIEDASSAKPCQV
jgi:hypothetical protein